jgi:phage gp46-like protein
VDIAIVWNEKTFTGDWAVGVGDLATDLGGLRSAVLLSFFTDQVAPSGYVPPPGSLPDRRGWWGDTYAKRPIGSLLWTLDRSIKSGNLDLLNDVDDILSQSVDWLVEDGVVDTVTVTSIWQQANVIGTSAILTQPESPPAIFNFGWAWQGA